MVWSATEEDIRLFLGDCSIRRVDLLQTPGGRPSGTAVVELETRGDVARALAHTRQRIRERWVTVTEERLPSLLQRSLSLGPGGGGAAGAEQHRRGVVRPESYQETRHNLGLGRDQTISEPREGQISDPALGVDVSVGAPTIKQGDGWDIWENIENSENQDQAFLSEHIPSIMEQTLTEEVGAPDTMNLHTDDDMENDVREVFEDGETVDDLEQPQDLTVAQTGDFNWVDNDNRSPEPEPAHAQSQYDPTSESGNQNVALTEPQELLVLEFCCLVSVLPNNRVTYNPLDDIVRFVNNMRRAAGEVTLDTLDQCFHWWRAFSQKYNVTFAQHLQWGGTKQMEPTNEDKRWEIESQKIFRRKRPPRHSAHLRKAKLIFFWTRYPKSPDLADCFPDLITNPYTWFGKPKEEKENQARVMKWFSNFR